MRKHVGIFIKAGLFLSIIYVWPSCQKKDDDTKNNIPPNGWEVSTLAGSGENGFDLIDGNGTKAKFVSPFSMTIDTNDNLYVIEINTPCIRKITPAGEVTTFVKEDKNAGYNIGWPGYLVTDGQGNFFTPNTQSYYINKLTTTASTIFAGNTVKGHNDGQGTDARFVKIMSIAVDPKGNLYLTDYDMQNHFIIRKITPAGFVSTLTINDNTGISADLPPTTAPAGTYAMAFDAKENLYVVGGSAHSLIKKIDPQGNATLFVGSDTYGFKDGKGQEARCNAIGSLTFDSAGNLWFCESVNNSVRRVSPDGTVTTIAGSKFEGHVDGEALRARFNDPYSVVIDKKGAVYVLESGNRDIRKLVHN